MKKNPRGKGRLTHRSVSKDLVQVSRQLHPFTVEQQQSVLRLLEKSHTIVYSCDASGVGRTTFYEFRHANPEYDEAVKEAYRAGVEHLEEEARRRGQDGHDALIVHQGRACYHTRPVEKQAYGADSEPLFNADGTPMIIIEHELILDAQNNPIPLTEKKFSDNLLMFTMKARDPERYADRQQITTKNDLPAVDGPELRDEILNRMVGLGTKVTIQETITRTVTVDGRAQAAPLNGKSNGKNGNGHGGNGSNGNGHG